MCHTVLTVAPVLLTPSSLTKQTVIHVPSTYLEEQHTVPRARELMAGTYLPPQVHIPWPHTITEDSHLPGIVQV